MEPERKIEKLLRAFAKKRRADADDSPKLHPATRRMLQVEVARRYAETPAEDSVSLWQFFRQQWAFLLSFALVIFFGATLFLPALGKAKYKAKNVVAMRQLKEIGVAAQMVAAENNGKLPATLDALTNELASDKTLTDPVSGKRFVFAAAGERLDGLQSNSVLAYSPEDKRGRAVLLADGNVQTMSAGQFDAAARRGLVLRVEPPLLTGKATATVAQNDLTGNRPTTPTAPAVPAGTLAAGGNFDALPGGGGGAGGVLGRAVETPGAINGQAAASAAPAPANRDGALLALAEQKQRFKTAGQADTGLSNVSGNSQQFRQALKVATKTPPVLASFEVQQNGNAMTVVDRDGSVYTGSIQPANPAAQDATLAAAAPPVDQAKDLGQTKNETSSAQNNYFFHVAGLNRISQQNVVFVGNVIPLTNAWSNAMQNQPANKAGVAGAPLPTANRQNSQPQLVPFSNARITGTVTVDATNLIEIDAVPVAP